MATFKRLQWTRHVQHMEKKLILFKVLYTEIDGKTLVGKPRNKWMYIEVYTRFAGGKGLTSLLH